MTPAATQGTRGGFDSAIHLQAEDMLDRWKFAREIYGVAVTGPQEWSVRIGIYGEWGTGKTSVLNMIRTMAKADNHLIVHFNPWSYSDGLHLWHSFVQEIERELFPDDEKNKPPWWKKWKKPAAPIADWLDKHGGLIKTCADDRKVSLAVGAIEILKSYVFSKRPDLEKALKHLGERRLIVLVDDLDRAQSTMVPEILFAFKELLDVGGIAFVCAFDPVVVGKALKRHHEGFEDGLKFLEKVMDYPRWLPEPSIDGLVALAGTTVEKHCGYVPTGAMEHAIKLLPRNPRAVRQFVRLLALLKDQVARHYEHELDWPTILAANVMKICYPRYAPALLGDEDFWKKISNNSLMHSDDEVQKRAEIIENHLEAVLPSDNNARSSDVRQSIKDAITHLATQLDPWIGHSERSLNYQMNIAEAPAAVTQKEFDSFLEAWRKAGTAEAADRWLSHHASLAGRPYNDVYREILYAAVRTRQSTLGRAAECIAETEAEPDIRKASDLMDILCCMILKQGNLGQKEKRLDDKDLDQCLKSMVHYADWPCTPTNRSMREREKSLAINMAKAWEHDVSAWLTVLKPFSGFVDHAFRGKKAKAIYDELTEIILPKYSKQILEQFRVFGFVQSVFSRSVEQSFDIRSVLLDVHGPLWQGLRSDMLGMLKDELSDHAVQQNSYMVFFWCEYLLDKEASAEDAAKMRMLMKDDEIRNTLWTAATRQPLSLWAAASIRGLPDLLRKDDINLDLPEWWNVVLAEGRLTSEEESTTVLSVAAQAVEGGQQ